MLFVAFGPEFHQKVEWQKTSKIRPLGSNSGEL